MEYNLIVNEETKPLDVEREAETRLNVSIDDKRYEVEYTLVSDHHLHLSVNGRGVNAFVAGGPDGKIVLINGTAYTVQDADLLAQKPRKKGANGQQPTEITPKTPAVVVSVLVKEGDAVKKGQGVVVLSAMKMETTLNAAFNGTVTAVNAAEGDKVAPGDILVEIEKAEEEVELEQ